VIEALRLLKEVGVQPKRTIRAVLFMNEENGLNGAKAYASKERPNEKHIVALESDAGGFSPRGFGISADSLTFENIAKWSYLFEQIDANNFRKGGGGADINELAKKGVPTIGVRVDGQKYFDYHHSDNDTFDKVDDRELELGAISIAILVYVLAQEGL
jgi:Zn-dependent M28 family amino/carboxypeptidase